MRVTPFDAWIAAAIGQDGDTPDPARLAGWQLSALGRALDHARKAPFYRDRLAQLPPGFPDSFEAFATLPTTTPADLAALKAAGLQIIYLGIESGDDNVLTGICKGGTAADMIAAGRRVMDAGIKLSVMVILGLGGRDGSRAHALETARVVSAVSPTMLSALTHMLHEGTPLRAAADRGDFQPLSPYELLQELRLMVENINVASPCIFRSNHVSNFLPLAGTLPHDKEQLLADIDEVLTVFKDKTEPTYNNTGKF